MEIFSYFIHFYSHFCEKPVSRPSLFKGALNELESIVEDTEGQD